MSLFFCISEKTVLADIIDKAKKLLPSDLTIKDISDLEPDSFSEVRTGDLVVIYYHGTLADPNAIMLRREYEQIVKILDERNVEVGIVYSPTSDNSRWEWPRPENLRFEIPINNFGFVSTLVQKILCIVSNESFVS